MADVGGSSPLMDTNGPFDYGLGQVPFKDQKRVRVPYGLPIYGAFVYRLGRRPLTPARGVRFPYALPTLFSSMVERRFVEPDTVVRSYHQGPIHSGVAQLVAQVTLNHKVVGSIPASRANYTIHQSPPRHITVMD